MLVNKQHDLAQEAGHAGGGNLSQPNNHKKRYPILVDGQELIFERPEITIEELLEKAGKLPVTCFSVFRRFKGCEFELVRPGEKINIEDPKLDVFEVKDPVVFHYSVDKEPETTEYKHLTPAEILKEKKIEPRECYLVLVDGTKEEILAFEPDRRIEMKCPGLHFMTRPWLDTVVIEEYGKTCQPVPPAHSYVLHIDKVDKPWPKPKITAAELLGLVGKEPSKFNVLKFYSNNPKPVMVGAQETIDLLEKCLVRFVTQPKTQTDGFSGRRQNRLPAEDEQFLEGLGHPWETISCGSIWLLIHDYPVPSGYNQTTTTLALLIPPSYPAAEIDMAYFHPSLAKTSGRPIAATAGQPIDGKTFQRWSRHRQAGDWQPGVDSVITHISLVDNWLKEDLNR
ncbi:multiubiquitin domain-containing protein [Sediminibacterium sp.]|uniref:multiubiquitin domain-containing protein n=1 Tax=Sediminibacterium sp. TaxID=1917865 RepID=UPI002731160D|nr:multiubiquitin domain-containing protein [Sediminibacterium sp.]MDP2421337.1 multiubiquitin domain-containing protein [Sediminibacterium sp.]